MWFGSIGRIGRGEIGFAFISAPREPKDLLPLQTTWDLFNLVTYQPEQGLLLLFFHHVVGNNVQP